jgi:hypothetical protein
MMIIGNDQEGSRPGQITILPWNFAEGLRKTITTLAMIVSVLPEI